MFQSLLTIIRGFVSSVYKNSYILCDVEGNIVFIPLRGCSEREHCCEAVATRVADLYAYWLNEAVPCM
jgi:hypothetical protein